jgi:hydrogenase expression/formation protein HypD
VSKRSTLPDEAERCYAKIAAMVKGPTSLMEVCGTHTMAISRFGLRQRMPECLHLVSGPGCPVCVTSCNQIDQAIAMARETGVTIMSFGDMMRVPGSKSSLDHERAEGRDVRVVYSSFDALRFATANPKRIVVLMGIGFETTSPTIAATVVRAAETGVRNFFVLPAFKLVVPAMSALIAQDGSSIDGFICPGHVSAIIGCSPYRDLVETYRVPCVVTGFEAMDILEGVTMLLKQIIDGRAEVEVEYRRAVPQQGNPKALDLLNRVFRRCDAHWRGIGVIPNSGLDFSEGYDVFDARKRVPVDVSPAPDLPAGCSCGAVMQGSMIPTECPLFGTECSPAHPVGPCMVSSEGACAAYMRYGG